MKIRISLLSSLMILVCFGLLHFEHPVALTDGQDHAVYIVWLVAASVLLARLFDYLLLDYMFQRVKGREVPDILRGLLALICYACFFGLIWTQILKRDLSQIAITSAVVTVVLGLALQDTLGNFFAGVSIHIEQPFHSGDVIKLDTVAGRVETITWRTTTIRTSNNTLIVFPNSKVAKEAVEVFPIDQLNRRVLRFQGPYNVPPRRMIEMIQASLRAMPEIHSEKPPTARVCEFTEIGIAYEILYWVNDYIRDEHDSKIRERIWYLFGRHGYEPPYPHRQLTITREIDTRDSEQNHSELLAHVQLFERLSIEERSLLAQGHSTSTYAPGELIVGQGQIGDSMFIILGGSVEVALNDDSGSPVAMLNAGNFFGEMALFTGEPRSADVRAVGEVEVLEIRKARLEQLLAANSELAGDFCRHIAERLVELKTHADESHEEMQVRERTLTEKIRIFFCLK